MNKPKRALAIFIAVMMLFASVSCSQTAAKEVNIYLITKGSGSTFWGAVKAGAEAAANEYGAELTVFEPSGEEAEDEQIAFLENAVKKLPDAVAISAIGYESGGTYVDKLTAAGVKVVEFDSLTESSSADMRVTIDNFAAGVKAFEQIRKSVGGKLKICELIPDVSTANAREREAGLRFAAKEDGNAEITVVAYIESALSPAKAKAESVLTDHTEVNAVVALNEWATLGAGEAVLGMNKSDEIFVSGFDNNALSAERLEGGAVDSLVLQNPYAMGYFSVKNAYLLSVGQAKAGNTVIETVVATRENMFSDDVVKLLFPFKSFK